MWIRRMHGDLMSVFAAHFFCGRERGEGNFGVFGV